MADNTITPAEFKVDLAQLNDAIGIVSGRTDSIKAHVAAITSSFQQAEAVWTGPAGSSFATFQAEFTQDMQNLDDLLAEMVTRMQSAYSQYVEVEQANTANFQQK